MNDTRPGELARGPVKLTPAAAGREAAAQRMVAGLRLLLSVLALAVTYIDPGGPGHHEQLIYSTLLAYMVNSGLVYAASRHWLPLSPGFVRRQYWTDVGFYIALVALSGGGNSIYFVLFFFGVLAAAFRDGFGQGLMTTGVSTALYVVVSVGLRPVEPDFDLDRFLIRTSMLPVIGYLIAYWGGREVRQVRELGVLNELSQLANPRLDTERILKRVMDRLRAFYDADGCILVTRGPGGETLLRRVLRDGAARSLTAAEAAPAALGDALLWPPSEAPVLYRQRRGVMRRPELQVLGAASPVSPAPSSPARADDVSRSAGIADWLEARSFISTALRLAPAESGRLYLISNGRPFDTADAEFLGLASEQFAPTLQYVSLVDRIAAQVIEDERRRIALDIHDHIIQPYIGLQFGLTALARTLAQPESEAPLPAARVGAQRLLELSQDGIADLRQYVSRLREGLAAGVISPSALVRFCERFSRATGIAVDLQLADALVDNDAVAQAALPIIAEALSNVRRHSEAERAVVSLALTGGWLRITVDNPVDSDLTPAAFVPQSIAERVGAIGGSVRVDTSGADCTRVIIDIPPSLKTPR